MTRKAILAHSGLVQGIPKLMPITEEEKGMVKQPEQFKNFFKEGEPLSEDLGERMARWAAGTTVQANVNPGAGSVLDTLLSLYANCQTDDDFQAAERRSGNAVIGRR